MQENLQERLIIAIDANDLEQFQNLLNTATEVQKANAAILAAFANKITMLQALIAKGADINRVDKDGNSCLHWAVKRNNPEMVQYLLENGADKSKKNKQGETPAILAMNENAKEILALLVDDSSQDIKPERSFAALKFLVLLEMTPRDIEAMNISWEHLELLVNQSYLGKLLRFSASASLLRSLLLLPFVTQNAIQPDFIRSHKPKPMENVIEEKKEESDFILVTENNDDQGLSAINKLEENLEADDNRLEEDNQQLLKQTALINEKKSALDINENKIVHTKSAYSKPIFTTSALPLQSETALKNVLSLNAFHETTDTFIDGIWSMLLTSLVFNGLINYILYPEERSEFSLLNIFGINALLNIACIPSLGHYFPDKRFPLCLTGNAKDNYENVLGSSLDNYFVWPFLVGLPLLFGALNAIRTRFDTRSLNTTQVDELSLQLKNYKPGFWTDGPGWIISATIPDLFPPAAMLAILPQPTIKRALEKIKNAIIWDAQMSNQERLQLFEKLCNFAHCSTHFTKLKTLSILADIVDGIDLNKLKEAGVEVETITTLLKIKIKAFQEVHALSNHYYLTEDPESPLRYLPRFLMSNYLMLNLGYPQKWYLQPLFAVMKAIKFYYMLLFYKAIIGGIIDIVDRYLKEYQCNKDGKVFLWFDGLEDYNCTVCGDLPVPYRDTFTVEDCFDAYLGVPRTIDEIKQHIIDRAHKKNWGYPSSFDLSNVTEINLSGQRSIIAAGNLSALLSKLKPKLPNIKRFKINVVNLTEKDVSGMIDFIQNSSICELDLAKTGMSEEAIASLSKSFKTTNIRCLSLNDAGIDDSKAALLAKYLPGTAITQLELRFNNIPVGIEAIAQVLPLSNITELNLWQSNITDKGCIALANGLVNSRLRVLNLYNNTCGDDCAIALADNLNEMQREFDYLDLRWLMKGIGPRALLKLAEVVANPLLKLQGLNIACKWLRNDSAIIQLISALPQSNLQEFYIENLRGNLSYANLMPRIIGQVAQANITDFGFMIAGCALIEEAGAFKELALALAKLKKVKTLGLVACLGLGNLDLLVESLASLNIIELDLSGNDIGNKTENLNALANLLSRMHDLKLLLLNGNDINESHIEIFSKILNKTQLEIISLMENNLGAKEANILIKNLHNTQVKTLILAYNNIGNVGAQNIAKALVNDEPKRHGLWLDYLNGKISQLRKESNTNLTYLDLRSNNINDTEMLPLCNALPYTYIKELDLRDNPIHASAWDNCGVLQTSDSCQLQPPLTYLLLSRLYKNTALSVSALLDVLYYEYLWQFNIDSSESNPKTPINEMNSTLMNFKPIGTNTPIVDANAEPMLFTLLDFSYIYSSEPIIVNIGHDTFVDNFDIPANTTYSLIIASPYNNHLFIGAENTFFNMVNNQGTNVIYPEQNNLLLLGAGQDHIVVAIKPEAAILNSIYIYYFNVEDTIHIIDANKIYDNAYAETLCQQNTSNSTHPLPIATLSLPGNALHFMNAHCEDILPQLEFNNQTALEEAHAEVFEPNNLQNQNTLLYTGLLQICDTFINSVRYSALFTATPVFITEVLYRIGGYNREEAETLAEEMQTLLLVSLAESPYALTASVLARLLTAQLSNSPRIIAMVSIGASIVTVIAQTLLTQDASFTWIALQTGVAMMGAVVGSQGIQVLPSLTAWGWHKLCNAKANIYSYANSRCFWSSPVTPDLSELEVNENAQCYNFPSKQHR